MITAESGLNQASAINSPQVQGENSGAFWGRGQSDPPFLPPHHATVQPHTPTPSNLQVTKWF